MNKINDLIKRYGVFGILDNLLCKSLGLFDIQIERKICLFKSLDSTIIDEISRNEQYVEFRELEYSDFVKYGNKHWFTADKIRKIKDLYENTTDRVFGVVKGDILVCCGWISVDKITNYPEISFPKLNIADGYLWDDYTDPSFRGLGYHRYLTNYRLYQLFLLGKCSALLFVSSYNKASYKGFYRLGFVLKEKFINYKIGTNHRKTTFKY